jgi:hypothetical protein
MVAITVILAAVIGAFVLEIGDQQETAPNTSFDSDEQVVYMQADGARRDKVNASYVTINHAGGDVADIDSLTLSVGGDPGSWTIDASIDDPVMRDGNRVPAKPQPNIVETLGSNEQISLSSGESLSVLAYGTRPLGEYVQADKPYRFSTLPVTKGSGSTDHSAFSEPVPRLYLNGVDVDNTKMPNPELTNKDRDDETVTLLEQGDDVQLVWKADSGGKTQTLFKYTVQSGSPDF